MKFSALVLLFVIGLLAFAEAGSDPKGKPKPKPKPKPKRKHSSPYVISSSPTQPSSFQSVNVLDESVASLAKEVTPQSNDWENENASGLVLLLSGAAVACAVAIIAVLRSPTRSHEALPQSSEHAAV